MTLAPLADLVLAEPTLAGVLEEARGGRIAALDVTGPEALRPFVVTGLVRAGRTVLVVTATTRDAEDLLAHLGSLLEPAQIGYFPSWETLPHERLSPRSDTVGRRLASSRPTIRPARSSPPAPAPASAEPATPSPPGPCAEASPAVPT